MKSDLYGQGFSLCECLSSNFNSMLVYVVFTLVRLGGDDKDLSQPRVRHVRNVLAVIKAAGYEVQVIEYLRVGWEREQLTYLLNAANLNLDKRLHNKVSCC